jgi:hypothetical protein
MKVHTRNLLLALLVYVAAFLGIVLVSMLSDIGISLYLDEETLDPDTMIFILTVLFTMLVSFAVYLGFYFKERHTANHDTRVQYLGLFPRLAAALIASVLSALVLFLCVNWLSDEGQDISILAANYTLLGIILGVTIVVDFVNFIVFKPRS